MAQLEGRTHRSQLSRKGCVMGRECTYTEVMVIVGHRRRREVRKQVGEMSGGEEAIRRARFELAGKKSGSSREGGELEHNLFGTAFQTLVFAAS